jgi:hypothetical protein
MPSPAAGVVTFIVTRFTVRRESFLCFDSKRGDAMALAHHIRVVAGNGEQQNRFDG